MPTVHAKIAQPDVESQPADTGETRDDQFVRSIETPMFSGYAWCRAWWQMYGEHRDLRIFVVRRRGEIVGFVAWAATWLVFVAVQLIRIPVLWARSVFARQDQMADKAGLAAAAVKYYLLGIDPEP